MGGHQSSSQQFSERNWRQVSSPFTEVLQYENCTDPNMHIERHRIRTTSEVEFQAVKELSYIRRHNSRWVAALYFMEEEPQEQEFCVSRYEGSLFLEKIPIRLCDLRNIPFPDALHLYDQALNGFYELARVVGCFPVESDYIGINERGVVKVWAGAKWPQVTIKGGAVSQEDMVRSVVECLEESIDKHSMPQHNPSIRNYLYRTADRIGFQQAIAELRNFVKATAPIPTRIHSLEDSPGRYDTDRERNKYLTPNLQNYPRQMGLYSNNTQSSAFIPNHLSPRFSAQREEGREAQIITTFRRVDSLSNEPLHRHPPLSHFAQQRPSSSIPHALQPNSSLPKLETANSPSSHRVSIGSHISPEPSQQVIASFPYRPNQPVYFTQPNRPMPIPQPSMPPTFYQKPSETALPPQLTTGSSSREALPMLRKNTQGQSIIMQLYTSQDMGPPAQGQTKKFGNNVRRSESYHVDPRRFDSATVINDSQPTSMRGIPQAPQLNAIQEVHNEHQWRENPSINHISSEEPESAQLQRPSSQQPMVFGGNYRVIDENDGKSSQDFLLQLKQMSQSTYPSLSLPTNNHQQKKKSVGFTDTRNVTEIDGNSRAAGSRGVQIGKAEPYLNGYYDSRMFPSVSEQHPSIDPDIWADLQRIRQ